MRKRVHAVFAILKIYEKKSACCFCHFKDLCYVMDQDLIHLEKQEDLEFLGGGYHG